jgi:outer membrane receptor protein involved in Fe transport
VPASDREFLGLTAVSGGKLRVSGFEVEGEWRPDGHWAFGGSTAYARNEILFQRDQTYTRLTGLADAKGQQPPLVPEWSASANATWRTPFGPDRSGFVRLEGSYRSTTYGDLVNRAETGARTVVNLRLGIEHERYRVTLFAENLFDDDHLQSIYADGDSASDPIAFGPVAYYSTLPRKRQFGITASYNF